MTRVKICGITRVEDAVHAARAGAHAIGLIFCAASPRCVTVQQANAISRALPPFVNKVGLFVDAPADQVRNLLASVPIDLLQFHGDEAPAFCAQFGRPYLKGVRMRPGVDLLQYAADFHTAAGLLLDAFVEDSHGGTGKTFDWNLIPAPLPLPLVLSGGLTAENVIAAVRRVRPWAVDASSGVEQSKGVKDHEKVTRFIQGVRDADQRLPL